MRRLHDIEQLDHDGSHAVEMSGTDGTFDHPPQGTGRDGGVGTRRVHLVHGRKECDIDSRFLCQTDVPTFVPWVAVEVFSGPELEGIDEDTEDADVCDPPSLS